MSGLVPTQSDIPARPHGFSRSEARQLQLSTNREIAAGIVKNTQLSVANFLTVTAIQHTTALTKQAYVNADGDEYLGSRLGALVDGYVAFARDEINSLRRMG